MKIKNISPNDLTLDQKQSIYSFLKKYIPQGTVMLPETIYDSATNWTILYSADDQSVLGFSAQKFFDLGYFSLIQIMATFISETMRGRRFAAIMMQGQLFWDQFISKPKQPIYWCTRTRVPSALAASTRYNNIYPKINAKNENIFRADFSEFIAKKVYGDHIHFEKETYKISHSYLSESIFTELNPVQKRKRGSITSYFTKHIDYTKNEAIFIISKVSRFSILKYLIMKTVSRLPILKWVVK